METECKGEVGVLGTVNLDTPSPALNLYAAEVILEVVVGPL